MEDALPYRGLFGDTRPRALEALPLPPHGMPSHDSLRPLKAWRYVGVYTEQLMVCVGVVRIARARQSFWAVWDRESRKLHEHTHLGRGAVTLGRGYVRVADRGVTLEVLLGEEAGIESVCPSGSSYAWTRKQGGVRASGTIFIDGGRRSIGGRAVIDDTAGYYARHTRWLWSAGVGVDVDGRDVAWNLVDGVNDPASSSERTVWIGAESHEPPPSRFAPDLTRVDDLTFTAEAERTRSDNLLVVRSRYRQPFGAFSGELPGGVALAEGFGVMEAHDAWW